MLYIVLKHVIQRTRIYSSFREIFRYRENMSNNRFREIHKTFLEIAKFEYFTKQIIDSLSHYLQITNFEVIYSKKCLFSTVSLIPAINGLNFNNFAKIAKSKYCVNIENESHSPIDSLSTNI